MELLTHKKIYLSFPISGYDLSERDGYAKSVIESIKDDFEKGAEFINPIDLSRELDDEHKQEGKEPPTYDEYLSHDLKIIDSCDAIVFCKDWDMSKGCLKECVRAALKKLKPLFIGKDGKLTPIRVNWKPYEPPKEPYELFGIECGKGWKSLYQPVLDKVAEYNQGKPEEEQIEIQQVKEKFGGLRIYLSYYTKELDKMVDEAEEKSFKICESCGKPGKTRGRGWIYTLCDDCWKKLKANRKKYEDYDG